MSHSEILFTLSVFTHLLHYSLARSSCRACSLNRISHSSNIHSQSGTLLFSLTFSYIHPFLLWFGGTFDGSKSNTRTSDPHEGIWVNRMGLCSISQLLLSASRCHRGNCKQLAYSLGNPLMLYRVNKILILLKCGSTRVQNSGTQLNIVVLTTLWPQTFFFFQFVYLLSPLSSYIVAALQREYEIFIRASCVEGTSSTW